jgi:hypothetical protein
MDNRAWNSLATELNQQTHLAQFYGIDDESLVVNVGRYLREGLERGDALILITTPEHQEAFARQLASDGAAVPEDRVLFLDSARTQDRIMAHGELDLVSVRKAVHEAIGKAREHATSSGVRVYGDLVGHLWQRGEYVAAIALEEFWNDIISASGLEAFCGYPVDVCSADFQTAAETLLCNHTQLARGERNEDLEHAILQAMDEVLGPRANALRRLMDAHYRLWWAAALSKAEASALWVRSELPDRADEILGRARRYYRAAVDSPPVSAMPTSPRSRA